MNVPNHEKKPFREMTAEERSAIVEAKLSGLAEWVFCDKWINADNDGINFDFAYRTKPRQLIIPWEVIKPEYKWVAMDSRGDVYLYKKEPAMMNGCFAGDWAYTFILNIDTTGIDWRESLVQRPDGV